MSYKKYEHNDIRIRIEYDECCDSPREWDCLGVIAYKHHRYTLGEELIESLTDWFAAKIGMTEEQLVRLSDKKEIGIYSSAMTEELKHRFVNHKNYISLPVYLFDHSGQSISTTPFSCRWDSCQVGYIYAERSKVLKEYKYKTITKRVREYVIERLKYEIAIFNDYVEGNCYRFVVEKISTEEEIDSCGGFIGSGKELIDDAIKPNIEKEYHEVFNYEVN